MLISRRKFLAAGSLATASLWIPKFLSGMQPSGAIEHKGKILVILQLGGGNDGLNTLVPVRNDIYYKKRPAIGLKREKTLTLTDECGLHPSLTAFKSLYDQGELAVINSVGYPNPDRSHFRSMDIWHTGSPSGEYWSTGWAGRYLDAQCAGRPTAALEIDDTLGLALKGQWRKGMALEEVHKLQDALKNPLLRDFASYNPSQGYSDAPVDYLYQTLAETVNAADYLRDQFERKPSGTVYPASGLGKHFKTVASLILGDSDTSIYYISHGSFDTHVGQEGQQKRLFDEMNAALDAFIKDMKAAGKWNDVMIVTFSEFGRRVAQNASRGTDHGAANNMFFLGGGLKQKGLLNEMPDLEDLADGDLKYKIDFRRVYATLLERLLGADHQPILKEKFELLGVV